MPEKLEWKKCEKCGGNIPKHWKRHEKCGWGTEAPINGTGTPSTAPVCRHQLGFCPHCGAKLA